MYLRVVPIIGQFADNHYRRFDNRHWPIIGRCNYFFTLLRIYETQIKIDTHTFWLKGKGKVFPYSLPSVGPGADPGVQAVSPQVTWSESRHLLSSSTFWLDEKMFFSVVRSQDSGTIRAGTNRILEFPWGRNLFILHRPLNTGMGWAGP